MTEPRTETVPLDCAPEPMTRVSVLAVAELASVSDPLPLAPTVSCCVFVQVDPLVSVALPTPVELFPIVANWERIAPPPEAVSAPVPLTPILIELLALSVAPPSTVTGKLRSWK